MTLRSSLITPFNHGYTNLFTMVLARRRFGRCLSFKMKTFNFSRAVGFS